MRHFATYFDRNYLAKGVTMLASLHRHASSPFTVHVICLDEITRRIVDALGFPHVKTVPVHAIERRDEALAVARQNRSRVEYYWTLTPVILDWLFDHDRSIDNLTYLDADLFFFSDPQPIFDELGERPLLIHEHRFSPDLAHLVDNGRFNVGLMVFRRSGQGVAALDRWREQCVEWCYQRNEDGKMGDQGYLDEWPSLYPELAILEHPGAGIAPWNHIQYRLGRGPDGVPTVEGRRAIFYHFHAFAMISPAVAVPASHLAYGLTPQLLELFFVPYTEALGRSLDAIRRVLPTFRAGFAAPEALTPQHTFIARREARDPLDSIGMAQPRRALTGSWDVYASPQLRSAPEAPPRVPTRQPSPSLPAHAAASVPARAALAATPPAMGGAPDVAPPTPAAPPPPRATQETVPVAMTLVIALDRMPRPLVPPSWDGEVVAVGDERHRDALATWVAGGPRRRVVRLGQEATLVERLAVGLTLARGARVALQSDVPRPLPLDVDAAVVRTSANAMIVDRAALEQIGGLDPRFATVTAAFDDLVLRAQAASLTPRVAAGCLGCATEDDTARLRRKWGFDPAAIPESPRVAPDATRRVPLPDLARAFVVDRAGTTWAPRAA